MIMGVGELRRDAERNRQLLLRTAHELMARDGLGVSYEEIARAAGTGVGTMYRRFPSRRELEDLLFQRHIDAVAALAGEASQHEDAWAGLVWFHERQGEIEAGHRGLGELMRGRARSSALVAEANAIIAPLMAGLLKRATDAGQLPPGVTPGDLVSVHLMVGSVMDATRDFAPGLWRRALAIALAGLRHADLPGPAPDDTTIEKLYHNDGKPQ
jgi:AcrR family transcriptional regulator